MNSKDYLMLGVLILLVFTRLPTLNKFSIVNDEGFYVYASKLLLEGHFPYSSFFFAHPIGFIAWMTPFIPFGIIGVRIALLLVQAGILILAFKITRNPIACLVLMFNPFGLRYFNYFLGFGMATLLILLAYYYRGSWHSPLWGALAILTRLFSLFPLYALSLFFKRRDKKRKKT